jgi:hypothetical protein
MEYSVEPEILGNSTFKLDGDFDESIYQDVCKTISEFTCIELSKVVYFVRKFGLNTFFSNPSLMGISKEQEIRLNALENLLQFGAENAYETDVTPESV